MKIKIAILSLGLACVAMIVEGPAAPPLLGSAPEMSGVASATPLAFIANAGQADGRALFYARTPGYTLWLTREGLVFDRMEKGTQVGARRSVSRLDFMNARRDVRISACDSLDYKVSYFFGREESEWKTGIPTSRAVGYHGLYDGIDLEVYGTDRQVEYDWVVAPGGRPRDIRFALDRGRKAGLDGDGNLLIETAAGRVVHRKPVAFQVIDGRRTDVEASFRETEDGSYGFAVGAYDPRFDLTIDPLVVLYGTFLGGWKQDFGVKVGLDLAFARPP